MRGFGEWGPTQLERDSGVVGVKEAEVQVIQVDTRERLFNPHAKIVWGGPQPWEKVPLSKGRGGAPCWKLRVGIHKIVN
jgi:hypothetical protein